MGSNNSARVREIVRSRRERYRDNLELLKEEHPNVVHGRYSTYTNWGCNCEDCTASWSQYCKRRKEERASRPTPDHVHGTPNGYGNYGCRCEPCTAAWTVDSVARARRRRERKLETAHLEEKKSP